MTTKINLNEKFGLFTEHWRPKVVATLNGQEVKIIKIMGEFPWHHHEHEDELFLVWKGNFRGSSTGPVRMKKRKFFALSRKVY